ncbi:hypothetical protein [Streptomyces atratus]
MDSRGGDCEQQARYFAPRSVLDGAALSAAQEHVARAVLKVVLLAGLPPYDIEAAADGQETGVALVPESRGLRVQWQQDPQAACRFPSGLCDAQQAAMNQALRAILSAHRFQVSDGPLSEAPLVLGLTRSDG